MKRVLKSAGFAFTGLFHAVATERNIQIFLVGFFLYCCIGLYVTFSFLEWIIACSFAGFFLVVEYLNTAIERLADVIDDSEKKKHGGHYHPGIKQAKDVAAAASLIALILLGSILVLLLMDHLQRI